MQRMPRVRGPQRNAFATPPLFAGSAWRSGSHLGVDLGVAVPAQQLMRQPLRQRRQLQRANGRCFALNRRRYNDSRTLLLRGKHLGRRHAQ